MTAAAPDTYIAPAHGWTCFHCGETFHVEAQARGHFGSDVSGEPMCVMRANAFARFPRTEWPLMYRMRELEAEVAKLRADAEDEHSQRFYARLASEIRGTAAVFKDCRTLRDVFNLYDSMEGRALAAEEESERLKALINTPELQDFATAIAREAIHQRERWGTDHDEGKTPSDWLWLVAHLATKATQAERYGDHEKYMHHIITAAAACCNWHAHATGADTRMKPGAPTP